MYYIGDGNNLVFWLVPPFGRSCSFRNHCIHRWLSCIVSRSYKVYPILYPNPHRVTAVLDEFDGLKITHSDKNKYIFIVVHWLLYRQPYPNVNKLHETQARGKGKTEKRQKKEKKKGRRPKMHTYSLYTKRTSSHTQSSDLTMKASAVTAVAENAVATVCDARRACCYSMATCMWCMCVCDIVKKQIHFLTKVLTLSVRLNESCLTVCLKAEIIINYIRKAAHITRAHADGRLVVGEETKHK